MSSGRFPVNGSSRHIVKDLAGRGIHHDFLAVGGAVLVDDGPWSLGATPTGLISLDGTGSATLGMVPIAVPIGADEKERPRPFCGMAVVPDGAAAE